MLTLPKGKPIDEDMLEVAMEDADMGNTYFLNMQTGEVVFLSEYDDPDEKEKLSEEIDGSSDYVRIECIPSREAYQWMEDFVAEIVSPQDQQAAEYAAAIKKGAPQALQGADLWHIGKNLADSVQILLARGLAEIRRGLQGQAMLEPEREETEPVPDEERCPPRSRSVKLAQEGRRAQKLDRDIQVIELHQQGLRAADIALRVGIGERTVYRWLGNGSFPEAKRRRRRPSLIDPYERYVLKWWHEGNQNGSQLYRELTEQGYKGSSRAMYSYLATLRTPQVRTSKSSPSKPQGRKSTPSSPAPLENFSAQRLSVYLSPREVRREAARRTGTDQAGQSKRRGRLLLGASVHADDPSTYGGVVRHLAL